MPFKKVPKFGEFPDDTEIEERDEQDLFKVRFPQGDYNVDPQRADVTKSLLGKKIINTRIKNIRPALKGSINIVNNPQFPTRTMSKFKLDK